MSYKRKFYTLKFPEGHAHHGLEVSVKALSYRDLTTITETQAVVREDAGHSEQLRVMDPIFEILAKSIIKWNLTDEDDKPVNTDVESLKGEDFAMIMAIVDAWTTAVTGISAKLGKGSNSGKPFPEVSIPMETLSPSHQS